MSHLNVGSGIDCTIRALAEAIKEAVGFEGSLVFDSSKPDGAPRKLLDVSLLNDLGWRHTISLKHGLETTYDWFLNNQDAFRSQ